MMTETKKILSLGTFHNLICLLKLYFLTIFNRSFSKIFCKFAQKGPILLNKASLKSSLFLLVFLFHGSFLCASQEENKIIVCENGLEMLQWDLDFLKEAHQSIELLPCFFGGEIAQQLLKAIELRLGQVIDLQVHILTSPILIENEDWALIYHLQKKYPRNFHITFSIQVAQLHPDISTIDNHIKMIVVDGTYFSVGGTNLEERHCSDGSFTPEKKKSKSKEAEAILPAGMRDQDIVGRGLLANELRTIFYQMYAVWEHYNVTQLLKNKPEDCKIYNHYFEVNAKPYCKRFESFERLRNLDQDHVKIILGGPHQNINAITQEYIRLIQEAKNEIILEHLYFLPVDSILKALMDAANRGVKITLITNGLSEISPQGVIFFCWGNRVSYVPLFYGNTFHFWDVYSLASAPVKNTRIFEYHIKDVILHKKIMLIDNKFFVVGSYNLGIKSALGDYELVVVIDSEEIVNDVLKVYEKDIKNSRSISPESARAWYFDPIIAYWGELQRKFSGFL